MSVLGMGRPNFSNFPQSLAHVFQRTALRPLVGFVAASTACFSAHPMDVIRTRMQVKDSIARHEGVFKTVSRVVKVCIYRLRLSLSIRSFYILSCPRLISQLTRLPLPQDDGIQGLWRGVSPRLVKRSISSAVVWYVCSHSLFCFLVSVPCLLPSFLLFSRAFLSPHPHRTLFEKLLSTLGVDEK